MTPRTGRATERESETPSFTEALDDNGPYVLAMYLTVGGVAALFVDYGALAEGQLTYRTVAAGGGGEALLSAAAGVFAGGFVATTLLAVGLAVDVFRTERRRNLDPYQLKERISLVAVLPAVQLLTVVLCPVVTEVTIVAGVEFLIALL
jgi:hypothetical protein